MPNLTVTNYCYVFKDNSEPLTTVQPNDVFEYSEKMGTFYKIKTPRGEGWIERDHIELNG